MQIQCNIDDNDVHNFANHLEPSRDPCRMACWAAAGLPETQQDSNSTMKRKPPTSPRPTCSQRQKSRKPYTNYKIPASYSLTNPIAFEVVPTLKPQTALSEYGRAPCVAAPRRSLLTWPSISACNHTCKRLGCFTHYVNDVLPATSKQPQLPYLVF